MLQTIRSIPGWNMFASIVTPQPLDRLGLLTLLTSLYFLQIWGFFLVDSRMWPYDYHAKLLLVGLSLVGIVFPRFFPVLVINCGFYIAGYFIRSPVASNNQLTALFVSLVIVFGAIIAMQLYRSSRDSNWREDIFGLISNPGRYILAGMYFYGIYHKINWDFLDPAVSCGVDLYSILAADFYLDEWAVGHYAAIYGTFIVEGIAMILLFSPRYKLIGILVGIPFHIAIGWTGYAYYKDFSTIVLVMYAMFLPRVMLERAFATAAQFVGGSARALVLGRTTLLAVFALHLAATGVFTDRTAFEPTHMGFVWFFTFYALAFYFAAIAFVPWNPDDSEEPSWNRWSVLLCIFPLIYFVNGASPYLGLKTESSIAMYSNLHTEAGQTNHLLHGELPTGFGFQTDLVYPISSNSRRFDRKYIGEGLALVRYEFDRMLAVEPDLQVTFEYEGEVRNSWENWENNYDSYPWIAQKYLMFKSPVDFNRPKVCSH